MYEYPELVAAVKLSIANTLGFNQGLRARTYRDIVEVCPPLEARRIECSVGGLFDEALIRFVTTAMLTVPRVSSVRRAVIVVDIREGFDGHLPWQMSLEERLNGDEQSPGLRGVQVDVVRVDTLAPRVNTLRASA